MNLTTAQPSAAARSRGLFLSVQEDISQNRANTYQMQGIAMQANADMSAAEATAQRDGMNASAQSKDDTAVGLLDLGAFSVGSGVLMGGDEFLTTLGEHGTGAVSMKIDNWEENEKMMNELDSKAKVGAENAPAARQIEIEDAATTTKKDNVRNAAQADAKMAKEDLEAAQTDQELYAATKSRAKTRKEDLIKKRDDLQKGADGRRGTFQMLGQGIGQVLQALRQSAAAEQDRIQGAHQLEQTMYKYVGDTNSRMSSMDGEVCQTLNSAEQALYQDIESMVRSNQPN